MKNNGMNALIITSQALSITSQLLAIGIEIGIVAGGYFLYKKVKKELTEEEKPQIVAQVPYPEKTGFKAKFGKVKKIFKAVID